MRRCRLLIALHRHETGAVSRQDTSAGPRAPGEQADVRRATPAWTAGLALSVGAAVLALAAHRVLPGLSPLLAAIVLGVVVGNVWRLPSALEPGITLASRRLLRLGIVVLGVQLSLRDIVGLGAGMVAVVVMVVAVGIGSTLWLGRVMGVPPMRRLLIACGFSICGAAAVAAVDGVVEAEDEDVATAIALVVAFGTMMIPLAPLLGTLAGFDNHERGLLAGGSIHEVAQVVAAGGLIGGPALGVAVLVKLARVLMLAPVIAVIGWRRRVGERRADGSTGGGSVGRRPPLVPLFVIGFLAAAVLRTGGVLPPAVLGAAPTAQNLLLGSAMFALGCGVHLGRLRQVGLRPVALAAVSTAVVSAVALSGVALVS
jgi:uncharacterized integral membrane protein (TIGR00698 family)